MHDLERAIGVCHHFGIPAMVCINKHDINEENTSNTEIFCRDMGVEVISKLPFDNVVTEALVQGLPVVEYSSNGIAGEIELLWQNVYKVLAN
jgi:MinD superfamily P-loop ATPase